MQAATQLTDSAEICEEFHRKTMIDGSADEKTEESPPPDEESDNYDEEEETDFSFSFSCVPNGDESPISADDLFHNGQIKPMYPVFDQSLVFSVDNSKVDLPRRPPVKNVFVEAKDVSTAAEMFCAWSGKAVEANSPDICKKSNSTGFSKLFRFRDLLNRSNSDGRDAFVFLNGSPSASPKRESSSEKKIGGEVGTTVDGSKVKGKKKGGKVETSSMSAHYSRNRALKEGDRRRTYLPYRPELVGFFTNVHGGLSRNVHPF